MWRSDYASRCFSAFAIGDDFARRDELARTTFVGLVYRRLTNREFARLGWESATTGQVFVFWVWFGSLLGIELRFQCKN